MRKKYRIILGVVCAVVAAVGVVCVEQYYRLCVSNLRAYDGEQHAYRIYPESSMDSVMTLVGTDYEIASMWNLNFHA